MKKKKEVGLMIRTLRLSHDMTQAELARKIHQSPSSITMYETGRREPDFETLEAMADIFNVPLSVLVDEDQQTGYIPVTSEASILAKGFDQMPEAERKRALEMAKLIFASYADLFEKKGSDDDET